MRVELSVPAAGSVINLSIQVNTRPVDILEMADACLIGGHLMDG